MDYLIRYTSKEKVSCNSGPYETTFSMSLIIEADSRINAFITAYDYLTRKGFSVDLRLKIFSIISDNEEKRNRLDFNEDDINELSKHIIGINEYFGDTHIESITEYNIIPSGKVIESGSTEEKYKNLLKHTID